MKRLIKYLMKAFVTGGDLFCRTTLKKRKKSPRREEEEGKTNKVKFFTKNSMMTIFTTVRRFVKCVFPYAQSSTLTMKVRALRLSRDR